MPTFVLADGQPMVLHGLKVVLESRADWTVVGGATDGAAALALVDSLQPEVFIIDILMPDLDGAAVVQQAKQLAPQTHPIIFSVLGSDASVRAVLNHGAMAYVLKHADADEMLHAVSEVLEGRRYLSYALLERIIDYYLQQPERSQVNGE
ncbi:MAG: response regulator transcription factor [Chloroflexaceae bacterium]|nr:response regulator transcription factor [Chloroflexaceae bacterium]